MLDNEKHIAAFRALGVEGLHPPAAMIITKLTADHAIEKAAYLHKLVKQEIPYPDPVTAAVRTINEASGKLTIAANAANAFHHAIQDYQSPSELIQMRIGWTCYLKGNLLADSTPFHLIEAIADSEITTTQNQLVTRLKTEDIKAAIDEVNAVLVKNRGAGGLVSRLTEKQIFTLNRAAEALADSLSDLDKATEAVNRLATQANDSAHHAKKSFSDAVSISIISGLLESPVMADALKAITPTSVISALS